MADCGEDIHQGWYRLGEVIVVICGVGLQLLYQHGRPLFVEYLLHVTRILRIPQLCILGRGRALPAAYRRLAMFLGSLARLSACFALLLVFLAVLLVALILILQFLHIQAEFQDLILLPLSSCLLLTVVDVLVFENDPLPVVGRPVLDLVFDDLSLRCLGS